jgi:aquaporin Z
MNPVRSLAPDIFTGDFDAAWIYVLGPFLGASIAVVFEYILKGPPTQSGTLAAQGDAGTSESRT